MRKTLRAILRRAPYGVLCRLLYEVDLRIKQSNLLIRLDPQIRKSKRIIFLTSSRYRRLIFNLDSLLRSVLFTEHIKSHPSDCCSYFDNSFNEKVFQEMAARVKNHFHDYLSASPYDREERTKYPYHPFTFRYIK